MTITMPVAGREADRAGFAMAAVLGAALSLVVTGFVYGTGNNLFHLIVIGKLYDEPQFKLDAFVQSMRFFAAGPFQLLQGSDRYIAPEHLFLLLACFSRLLSFIGFLACASLLGLTTRTQRLIFVTLLAFTVLLQEYSFAGNGGLFISAFTHSEIDNGLSLIAIYYAARGRLVESFAVNGLAFFTNAFIAVWNAGPVLLIIAVLLYRRRLSVPQLLRRGGVGLAVFLLLASPVLANVLSNPEFGRSINFDYQTFLRQYFPLHFLFDAIAWRDKVGLAATVVLGALAFFTLARRYDVFQAALWGYVAIYAVGIGVPAVTSSPAILNLHLLRSSSGIQLIAALGGIALATTWLTSDDRRQSRVFGPLLVVTLCTAHAFLVLAPLVIGAAFIPMISRRVPRVLLGGRPLPQCALAAVLLAFLPLTIWRHAKANEATAAYVAHWFAVGDWARRNTPGDAMFLVPAGDLRDSRSKQSQVPRQQTELDSAIFDYASHRQVWIDSLRGAAVMWSPSYHALWRKRMEDVSALSSLDGELAYAGRNGIGFVVDDCDLAEGRPAAFQAGSLCVFSVPARADLVRLSPKE